MANPASGRDIRRLVAQASVFPIAEKCNMVTRVLSALGSVGVARVIMMPDVDGIADRVRRALETQRPSDPPWPNVEFLEMPIEASAVDTEHAAQLMAAAGVALIVVLGGDGTNRIVAKGCGATPLLPLSTGTNNVFPAVREATIAGLAAGLVASGRVATSHVSTRNKVLRVEVNGARSDLAIVDVAVSSERWIGSRALWRPETLRQIFVAFAEADAVGLSSIAGLLRPVSRQADYGLRVDLATPDDAMTTVLAPIAPGRIVPVGVAAVEELVAGERQTVPSTGGVIALDGEREIEFSRTDHVTVHLDTEGPLTIDIDRVMERAATEGLLIEKDGMPNGTQ